MATAPTAPTANKGKTAIVAPVRAVPFKIESSLSEVLYFNALIYGTYGVGKTVLVGSAADVPSMQDVLMIDAESGSLSISDKTMDRIKVTTFSQVARIQEFLEVHCAARDSGDTNRLIQLEARFRGVEEKDIKEPKMYRTLILDSLSEVELYNMYALLGITQRAALDDDSAVAEWSEYKRNFNMMQRMVRGFRDLPMNVLMTASESFTQDETKAMIYKPQLTGKLANAVQGTFDMVGYLASVKGEEGKLTRKLYVQKVGRFDAKCRFPAFKGTHFENPTIGSILKAVKLLREE